MAAYVPPHRRRGAPVAGTAQEIRAAFAKVFCVNLKRRPDRLKRFSRSIQSAAGDLSWSRFEAVDGAVGGDDEDFEERWNATRNSEFDRNVRPGPRIATSGERGCALSHVALWRCAAERAKSDWTLICEDDCRFDADFDRQFRRLWPLVPTDAELVYLGFSDRGERRYVDASKSEVFAPEYGFATHCYAVRPAAAATFLQHLPVAGPLDVWLGDNKWFDVKVYCVVVAGKGWRGTGGWLATQDSKPGDCDVRQSSRDAPATRGGEPDGDARCSPDGDDDVDAANAALAGLAVGR